MAYFQQHSSSLPLEVQLTICSAKHIKNVNWRHGDIKPYAVVWVDPDQKHTTKVDEVGDTSPTWDDTIIMPLLNEYYGQVFIDIVHAYPAEDTKALIGSGHLSIKEVIDEVGVGEWEERKLKLKRPSGRPHGELEVKIFVRDPNQPPPYRNQPEQPFSFPYAQESAAYYGTQGVYSGGNGAPPPQQQEKTNNGGSSSSRFGMGTGLAVGVVAGALGGLAIEEGIDYFEDEVADDVEKTVENDGDE